MQNTEKLILDRLAAEIRLESMKALANLGFGHVGGVMSIVETLAVLYGKVMRYIPKNPKWEGRDWLVCSKGHAGPALYAVLAIKGFFDKETLLTLNQGGTNLPSHCDRNKTLGVDITTGSLGQGISNAIGVALGNRMSGRNCFTFLIMGDGELDEGQVWEGVLAANQFKLGRLIAFVDCNRQQLDGYTHDIIDLGDIAQKFAAFGWHAATVNGHDVAAISEAVDTAKQVGDKPSVIVLETVKGKGCSFAEGIINNHHMAFDKKQADTAIAEMEEKLAGLL